MIKKISVIIPCHNEIHTLKEIITRIQNVDPKSLFEIIVVDDFSDDGSRDLLQKDFSLKISKLILNNKNYGKGFSVKKGIESASGEIIIILGCPNCFNKDIIYKSKFENIEIHNNFCNSDKWNDNNRITMFDNCLLNALSVNIKDCS